MRRAVTTCHRLPPPPPGITPSTGLPQLCLCSPHLPPSEAGSGASGSTSRVPGSPSASSSAAGSWGSRGDIRAGHSDLPPSPRQPLTFQKSLSSKRSAGAKPVQASCRQSGQLGSTLCHGAAPHSTPSCPPLAPHSPTAPRRGCCPLSHAPALLVAPTAWCQWGCANNRCPRCPAPASIRQAGLSLSQRSCGSRRNLGGRGEAMSPRQARQGTGPCCMRKGKGTARPRPLIVRGPGGCGVAPSHSTPPHPHPSPSWSHPSPSWSDSIPHLPTPTLPFPRQPLTASPGEAPRGDGMCKWGGWDGAMGTEKWGRGCRGGSQQGRALGDSEGTAGMM